MPREGKRVRFFGLDDEEGQPDRNQKERTEEVLVREKRMAEAVSAGYPEAALRILKSHITTEHSECSRRLNNEMCLALTEASRKGYLSLMEALLSAGADANGQQQQDHHDEEQDEEQNEGQETPLLAAASSGERAAMQLLISGGAHPGEAMEYACETSDVSLLQFLLRSGGNAKEAAAYACHNNMRSCVEVCLETDAVDVATQNSCLCSAIMLGHKEMIELLLIWDADPDAEQGFPLYAASQKGDFPTVRMLLQRGSDPKLRSGSALVAASENGHQRVVNLLIDRGSDPNAMSGTPLIMALKNGHLGIAECLLSRGADPRIAPRNAAQIGYGNAEDPPLVQACRVSEIPVCLITRMLAMGADPSAANGEAVRAAASKGRRDLVEVLQEAGARRTSGRKRKTSP